MFAFLMGLKSVTPQELRELVQAQRVCVLDLNAHRSWLQARVPGALHLRPDYAASDLPGDKATTLVFYCSNVMCRKAPVAARRAKSLGLQRCARDVGWYQRLARSAAAYSIG
jgi:rhodanese-related sulfurtransferase